MKTVQIYLVIFLMIGSVIIPTNAIMSRKELESKIQENSCVGDICGENVIKEQLKLNVTTQCNKVDLSAEYKYGGIVRSGYLSVGYGGSALSFIFYGKSDIRD